MILDRNLPDTDGVKVLEELLREARERERRYAGRDGDCVTPT